MYFLSIERMFNIDIIEEIIYFLLSYLNITYFSRNFFLINNSQIILVHII